MTDSTASAAPPKKRSLFKRAAWQDAPKKDSEDMFSHSNEFKDIVAEQARTRAEEKKKAEAARKRKHSEPRDQKRRRVSNDSEELVPPKHGSTSKERVGRTAAKARSITSVSPAPSRPPPDSLTARYDSLTKSASSSISLPQKESHVIDLGDSDEDDDSGYVSKSVNDNPAIDYKSPASDFRQDIAVRPSKPSPIEIKDDDDDDNDDDDDDEDGDPAFAALRARARARVAAAKAQANGDAPKAPIVQLLIDPQMPDAKPLMVKVRVDSTIGKPRLAWCGKEKFSEQMTRSVFFTWKGTRLYDSTSIKRLGIQVDDSGNVSVQGDSNIYDDVNLPKIHVEAWTEDVYKQRKKEDAAAALAKKLAAEAAVVTREKTPTPEPEPELEEKRFRLVLKAKGYSDFKLTVKESTTVAHIASAYKTRHKIDKNQPVTLMFDGDRMMPLDTVADYDVDEEETCMIEVLLK